MPSYKGSTKPKGDLSLSVIRARPTGEITLHDMMWRGLLPTHEQSAVVRNFKWRNMANYLRGAIPVIIAKAFNAPVIYAALYIKVIRADGTIEDYGCVGHRVVTTAGVTKIVDFLRANDTTTGANFKFHGIGTGSTAEASGDTALVTELTTEYNPNSTRPTGSQTNNGANVYETVGTITVDATPAAAIREHGIFSSATVGAGTLLDRTVFAAITLSSGDSIQATYDLTVNAGG